jgi:hypothetical protein
MVRINRILSEDPFGDCPGKRYVKPLSLGIFFLALNEDVDISAIRDQSTLEIECEDTVVQLTARCAGFLEISKPKAKTMNLFLRHVRYFHRTTKDFLETDSRCAKLLDQTANTHFNPYFAMMKSSILALHIRLRIIDSVRTRYASYHRAQMFQLASDVMVYAYHIDDQTDMHRIQVALLDHFSRTMDSYGIEWGASPNDWIMHTLVVTSTWTGGGDGCAALSPWKGALYFATNIEGIEPSRAARPAHHFHELVILFSNTSISKESNSVAC